MTRLLLQSMVSIRKDWKVLREFMALDASSLQVDFVLFFVFVDTVDDLYLLDYLGNAIGDEGARFIAEELRDLEHLDVSGIVDNSICPLFGIRYDSCVLSFSLCVRL